MKIQIQADEIIAGQKVAGGTQITVTTSNAEELYALVGQFKAIEIATANSAISGNLAAAIIGQQAKLTAGGISLTSGVFPIAPTANTPLALIRTEQAGTITIANGDDGGGRFAVAGRFLVATGTAMTAGTIYTVSLAVGGRVKQFNVMGAPAAAASGGGTTPVLPNILLFGDSITEYGWSATEPPSSASPYIEIRGKGGPETALSRMGWPRLIENYHDAIPLEYAVASNPIKYHVGDNLAQGGGADTEFCFQMDLARRYSRTFDFAVLAMGTNYTNWAAAGSQKDAYNFSIRKFFRFFPGKTLIVRTAPPCVRPHVAGMNADIRTIVAAYQTQGFPVFLDDRELTYTGQAAGSTVQQAADFETDNIHPTQAGIGRRDAPDFVNMLTARSITAPANGLLSDVAKAREVVALGTSGFNGTPTTITGVAGVSGQLPAGMTPSWSANTTATVACSVVAHPTDATRKRIRMVFTPLGTNSPTFSLAWTPYSGGGAANAWLAGRLRFQDNARALGSEGLLDLSFRITDASDATRSSAFKASGLATGRTADTTWALLPRMKMTAGATGVTMQMDIRIDTTVVGAGLIVEIDEDQLHTVLDPTFPLDTDPTSYDTDAQAYFTASGLRDRPTKAAINTLVLGLKAAGLWAKMDDLVPIGNFGEIAALTNLRRPTANYAKATGAGYDYIPGRGYVGFTNSAWNLAGPGALSTYTQFTQNSASVFTYCVASGAGESVQIGTSGTGSTAPAALIRPAGAGAATGNFRINGAVMTAANPTDDRTGLWVVTRTGPNAAAVYRGGSDVAIATSATASADLSAQAFQGLRTLLSGPAVVGADTIGFIGAGAGLTGAESVTLNGLIKAFFVAQGFTAAP